MVRGVGDRFVYKMIDGTFHNLKFLGPGQQRWANQAAAEWPKDRAQASVPSTPCWIKAQARAHLYSRWEGVPQQRPHLCLRWILHPLTLLALDHSYELNMHACAQANLAPLSFQISFVSSARIVEVRRGPCLESRWQVCHSRLNVWHKPTLKGWHFPHGSCPALGTCQLHN